MSSPSPEVEILSRSAAKLINKPKSEGLIGDASTLMSTSSSPGVGTSEVAIDKFNFPSLVISDLISLDFKSVIFSPCFKLSVCF